MGAVNIWKSGKRRAEKGRRDRKQNFEYNLAWPGEIWGGGERGGGSGRREARKKAVPKAVPTACVDFL